MNSACSNAVQKKRASHLDKLVPSRADNNRVLRIRAESHARNPVLVSLLGDGELAVTKSVPEFDCPIAGSGNNLPVIGGEGDRENVVGVSNKSAGGGTGGELPEAESLVPRSRESVGTVRGNDLYRMSANSYSNGLQNSQINVHSRKRCGSGREGIVLGSRRKFRRGSSSR